MAELNPDFTVIYEDDDVIVADKPAGLLSVPIPDSCVKNLYDLVTVRFAQQKAEIQTVHRIDRYTSGLMVFTRNPAAYSHLFDQFKNHTPVRCYLALVRGIVEREEGDLVHYLKLVRDGFRNIIVEPEDEGAARAHLTYRVRERFLNATLLEVYLDTGLKNQIRVQFEAIGHQLVGDQHYAPEEEEEPLINRQALHSWQLAFNHPTTKNQVTYTAQLPPDMLRLIDHFRWQKEMIGRRS